MPRHQLSICTFAWFLVLAAGWQWAPRLKSAFAAPPKQQKVQVVIDYNDGAQIHFTAIPWQKEMTVINALRAVEKHPRGVKSTVRGSGLTALVVQIDDLKNEGGGENSRNWIYRVNGKPADVGAGVYQLEPGDEVLWKFEAYEP